MATTTKNVSQISVGRQIWRLYYKARADTVFQFISENEPLNAV